MALVLQHKLSIDTRPLNRLDLFFFFGSDSSMTHLDKLMKF